MRLAIHDLPYNVSKAEQDHFCAVHAAVVVDCWQQCSLKMTLQPELSLTMMKNLSIVTAMESKS